MYSFTKALFLAVAIMLFSNAGSALAGGGKDCVGKSPLPGYNMEILSADIPKKLSNFYGVWDGFWRDRNRHQDGLCHTFVVKNIEPDGTVSVIYSTGKYRPWDISRGSYYNVKGKIKNGELSVTLQNGVNVSYRFSYDELLGNYKSGRSFSTLLKRKN